MLVKNFFSTSLLHIANYIQSILLFPYLAHTLGPEKLGALAGAWAIMNALSVIVDYGFNISATQLIARHREDSTHISTIFTRTINAKIILLVLSAIGLTVLIYLNADMQMDWPVFALSFGTVIGNCLYPAWLFQGMESMHLVAIANLAPKFVTAIAIVWLVKTPADYLIAAALNATATILTGALSLKIAKKHYNLSLRLKWNHEIASTLRESREFFLSRLYVIGYTGLNIPIATFFFGPTAAGQYAAADKIYVAMQQLFTPLASSLIPHIANTKNTRRHLKIFIPCTIITAALSILTYTLAPHLVNLIYGPQFTESVTTLRILCLAALATIPSILLGYPLLGGMGYSNISNRSVAIGFAAYCSIGFMIWFFAKHTSPMHIAFVVFTTESIVLIYRLYWVIKLQLWRF